MALVARDSGSIPPEQLLNIDAAQLRNAKDAELLKSIRVRFIEDGPDRTLDAATKYGKTCTIEGLSAQQSIFELRQQIAEQEKMPLQDVNLFGMSTVFPDDLLLADCYADWMGYGLEDWPPKFVSKPRVKGFEVYVDVPASRDTSIWENGRMQTYHDLQLIFDVNPSTKVSELKAFIAKRTKIPASRQKLTAHLRPSMKSFGYYVDLEDDKTMSDYDIERVCVAVKFEKSAFDEQGNYVFDDAYWDDAGYHPQPPDCWIPLDSLGERGRPDAHNVDATQPLSIVSDRRAKEAAEG